MPETFTREQLREFSPSSEFFVGIDSDGCIFPTMEIKQKKCFHPAIIEHWQLQDIAQYVREAAEFVNLYSRKRGRNRFPCLVDTMDVLRDRPEVIESGVELPDFEALIIWMKSAGTVGNPELQKAVEASGDPVLTKVLEWSLDVNERVSRTAQNIIPFQWALKSLQVMTESADTICISQTPTEALVREWAENDIRQYVKMIAGQELGTKSEHLAMATGGKYEKSKVLMIGDAPGDCAAARENGALFYPINPGREEESWERFHREAFGRFLEGSYNNEFELSLIKEFEDLLPETPPWRT
jgi:phosphoglycolate phosphatase-like HAD superfamily hydrolase